MSGETVYLTHGRVRLALHRLRASEGGHDLLLLHGLGERTPPGVPEWLDEWPGSVWGLDFTGHGESTVPVGGGYTAEVLMADVDAALCHLGKATLLGRGLGAYVALLTAGARADAVLGAILCDGPGLIGGGIRPGSPWIAAVGVGADPGPPDPFALVELSRDVRPPDYAVAWVRHAIEYGSVDPAIAVCCVVRPEWLEATVCEPGVVECSLGEALRLYSGAST